MIVGVVGSIGKTSTKFAIARVLAGAQRVRWQEGNYNAPVTVPLVFFGHSSPNLMNPLAWLRIFMANERQIRGSYPYDSVVVELGTDAPGDIIAFKKYLHCDLAVVTAITPEHMEFFGTLGAVAQEELSVAEFADRLLINADLCGSQYYQNLGIPVLTYGLSKTVDYKLRKPVIKEGKATLQLSGELNLDATLAAVSIVEAYSATAAAAVADLQQVPVSTITKTLQQLTPVAGRMQRLRGIHGSTIIDDSYNASPVAVKAALDALYAIPAEQKIAILGNMNELGKTSPAAHTDIGNYCNSKQLDWLVTIGPDANKYLAPAAQKAGCQVASFTDPYAAGEFVQQKITPHAVILVKGSQNLVYAEEAIKAFLQNPTDATLLVRQSSAWLRKKKEHFNV